MRKRGLTILAAITGLLVTAVLVTTSLWPVIHDVATGETVEYLDLLPQYFSADPKRVVGEVEAAVGTLDGWQLAGATADTVTATADGLFGVSAVTITVKPLTEFATQVDVRSTSDFARGDFGQNARNIRAFQSELNGRLGAVRFDPWAKQL